jgi:hypothetical protein
MLPRKRPWTYSSAPLKAHPCPSGRQARLPENPASYIVHPTTFIGLFLLTSTPKSLLQSSRLSVGHGTVVQA